MYAWTLSVAVFVFSETQKVHLISMHITVRLYLW